MPSDSANDDIFQVAVRVGRALDAIGVRYAVVGSVASSILGDPRTTNDVDFLCALPPAQVSAFAAALGDDFDIDEQSLREAMASGSSWNIFFNPIFSKVDLFALDGSAFQQVELRRARRIKLEDDELVVLTPEDCVLSKLLWFRAGGGVSSQQWRMCWACCGWLATPSTAATSKSGRGRSRSKPCCAAHSMNRALLDHLEAELTLQVSRHANRCAPRH